MMNILLLQSIEGVRIFLHIFTYWRRNKNRRVQANICW